MTDDLCLTYPRSRSDFSWLLVRRRGSPEPSVATASNSSNGGATKRSRKFTGRYLRLVLPLAVLDTGVGNTVLIDNLFEAFEQIVRENSLTQRKRFPMIQELFCHCLDVFDKLFDL